MKREYRKFFLRLSLVPAMSLAVLAPPAMAQNYEDLQKAKSPLVLEEWGSFFVGGETAVQTAVELGLSGTGSTSEGHCPNVRAVHDSERGPEGSRDHGPWRRTKWQEL